MILADFHMHSSHSDDSDTPMENQIEAAIDKGLKYICFTEHMDKDYVISEEDGLEFILDTKPYYEHYLKCRDKYSDRIKVLFGVEYGLQDHLTNDMPKYIDSYPFDFVIGSSHICNRKDPYYDAFFEGRTAKEAHREYFEYELKNAKLFDDYDVYGHLDYVVRYGPDKDRDYSYFVHSDVIDELLKVIIDKGKGIEINTGGYKSGINNTNPGLDIIRRYRELGGEIITVGSDAHVPEYVGSCFEKAEDILRMAGFNHYTIFENRKPIFLPLG